MKLYHRIMSVYYSLQLDGCIDMELRDKIVRKSEKHKGVNGG